MGRRTDVKAPKPDPKPEVVLPHGLLPGDKVRWQRAPGGRWREGIAHGLNADQSIEVIETSSGKFRSLFADRLQVKMHGKWIGLTDG